MLLLQQNQTVEDLFQHPIGKRCDNRF